MATRTHGGPVRSAVEARRAEDQSLWMRSAWMMEKYKILWIPVSALIVALGFDFQTPAHATKVLQSQIDTLKHKSEAAVIAQDALKLEVGKLLKVPCLDPKRNERDLALIGIDCSEVSRHP